MINPNGPTSCTRHLGRGHLRSLQRQGFTLFEVSISLVLVAFGVVSVLMLFPSGLKAQQMARFQIYAAAKAEEMIEQFNGTQHSNPAIDSEGFAMWDQPVAHKAQSWDLESRLSAHRFGIMPLPLDVARRLDSDGDEIQHILDQGGYVYYSQPLASTGTQEQGAAKAPPNEAQKLIIGVKGYAQQNCLSSFPLKNWPYHTPMPSPPLQMHHMADKWLPLRKNPSMPDYRTDYYSYYSWPWRDNEDQKFNNNQNIRNNSETYCVPWETSPPFAPPYSGGAEFPGDPDIQKVYDWPVDLDNPGGATVMVAPNYPTGSAPQEQPLHVGYFPYACGRLTEGTGTGESAQATHLAQITPSTNGNSGQAVYGQFPSRDACRRYVAATLWYAKKKGFDFATQLNQVKDPYLPFTILPNTYADRPSEGFSDNDYYKEVQAFRFLAHATACLTGWYSYSSSETENLSTGVRIPQVKLDSELSPPDVVITHRLIKYYHERSLYLINTFASNYPNDWAMPRPLNRVTMMDFPLLQFDLFTPALPYGSSAIGTQPGNPLYNSTNNTGGVTINNVGPPAWTHIFGRSNTDNPQQWRVVSSEPMRRIGVSATFPTSGINSRMQQSGHDGYSHFGNISHYNLTDKFAAAERCRELIFWVADWQSYEDCETAPSAPVDASKYPIGAPRANWHAAGHVVPTRITRSFNERMIDMEFRDEQLWSYRNPEKTLCFFSDPQGLATGTDVENIMILNRPWTNYPDKGTGTANRMTFCGLYGADRNFNKKLDRGPLPKSVRMRAVEVARFSFYDPRVQAILR